MKKWLGSVAFLLVVGVSASEAQFSPAPLLNPGVRPGTGPYFGPYQAGGFGNGFGGGFGPTGYGGFYGQNFGNYGGFQQGGNLGYGGFQQGGNLGFGANMGGLGVYNPYGSTGLVYQQAGNVTGHPTRFNAYSQYFNNQGTGLLTNVLTSTPQLNASGMNARFNNGVGTAPQQQGQPGQQGQPQPNQLNPIQP